MTQHKEIVVLQSSDLPTPAEEMLGSRFELVRLTNNDEGRRALLADMAPRVRGIAGTGKGRVDADLMAALPNLEIISVTSAGLDGIDTAAAAERGIPIFNTSHILADDVADLALWLILGATRNLVQADRFIRNGEWPREHYYPLGRTIAGMKIGILGLGHIGKAIARRLEVMGAVVGYSGRSAQSGIDYPYFGDAVQLASWCELLVVSCPSTAETYRMVDQAVLSALGPDGILVNISRGAVVDEAALVDALQQRRIFGAGLDVFENEPHVGQELIDSDRTILLPHIGSATTGTRTRMWRFMVDALFRHFDGRPDRLSNG